MPRLPEKALVVFVSDSHIGGDPGCDGFESPAELRALFDELAGLDRPVELILAGDFFDFLQIGAVPDGKNRASLTMSRPEYLDLFAALKEFRSGEGKRVVYLPGNHDAEAWWNPEIQRTLREEGLVDEFAYSYLAEIEGARGVVYCEHGNQLDPANTVEDYSDRLDTPLGHHVVMDFTRRVAPYGEVSPGLDLSEIKMVYPLVAIPGWIAGRYFYDLAGKVTAFLLLPLLVAYALYRVAAYLIFSEGLPRLHELFVDISVFGLFTVALFAVFFLVVRHVVRRTVNAMSPGEARDKTPRPSPADASRAKVKEILTGRAIPPMAPALDPSTIDVFVSGHTHLPSLDEIERPDGGRCVAVNSGCYLRQLHPVRPHLKGPPVFVSRFVLTHARVFAEDGILRVELWEQPKRARQSLSRIERLLSYGRRPPQPQPGAEPRVRAASTL